MAKRDRPIERLYPIEVKSKVDVTENEIDKSKSVMDSKFPTSLPSSRDMSSAENIDRPSRIAADNDILMRRLAGSGLFLAS